MNKRNLFSFVILFILGFSCFNLGYSCSSSRILQYSSLMNENNESDNRIKSSSECQFVKGVSLSPLDFAGNLSNFFIKTKEAGTCLTWIGNWSNPADFKNDTGIAYIITDFFLSNGFTPIISIHTNTPDKINSTHIGWVKHYVETYKPKYFGIGNEINGVEIYNKTNGPQAFYNFTELFNNTYYNIKLISPETKIFTIFQLEYMKGLQGGLFGGKNDTFNLNDWFLMNNASKADFFAFTTYPCLIFKNPEDMPLNYYSEINTYTNKPIAFTEIGWFYNNTVGPVGWESTKQEQADFINRYFNITKTLNTIFNIWAFLYDKLITQTFFNRMGLLSFNETTSPAWIAWINAGKSYILPSDDDDDEKTSESVISGYNIIFLMIGSSIAIAIITINLTKIKKKKI